MTYLVSETPENEKLYIRAESIAWAVDGKQKNTVEVGCVDGTKHHIPKFLWDLFMDEQEPMRWPPEGK